MASSDHMMAQMTLTVHIVATWSDAKSALAEMSIASRCWHLFWLMGPLFLLIECRCSDVDCYTHPHDYNIHFIGKTEIMGLVFGCAMLGAIIWYCAQTIKKGRAHFLMETAVIIPFGLFSPFNQPPTSLSNGITYLCGARLLLPYWQEM